MNLNIKRNTELEKINKQTNGKNILLGLKPVTLKLEDSVMHHIYRLVRHGKFLVY